MLKKLFFNPKIFLFILAIRPTLDLWREFQIFDYHNFSLNLNVFISILFLIWMILFFRENKQSIQDIPFKGIFVGLIAIEIISIFYSYSASASLIEATKFINLFLIFSTAFILAQKKQLNLKTLSYAILLSAIIPFILGAIQFVGKTGLCTYGISNRIFGTFAHPNIFAFYFLFVLFILFQFLFVKKDENYLIANRLANWSIFTAIIFSIILTYTRAAWLGLLIFIVVVGYFQFPKLTKKIIFILLTAYCLLFPTIYISNNLFHFDLQKNFSLINRLTSVNRDANSVSWRLTVLKESLPIFLKSPVFGYGFGTFPQVWEANRSIYRQADDSAESHNDYLRMLIENGVIGLALYVFLLFGFLFKSYQLQKISKQNYLFLFAWIIVFAFLSSSDNMLHHTAIMWMTMAVWGAGFGEGKSLKSKI